MRICIYTKRLTQRLDEGIVRVAHEIAHQLLRHHEVLTLFSVGDVAQKEGLKRIPTNRSGLNLRLRKEVRTFRPDVILYIPRGPVGLSSLLFARVLKWYGGSADLVILAPQPKGFTSTLSRKCVPLLRPDLILATSRKDQRDLEGLGCAAQFVPLGVDIERFTPVAPSGKSELRCRYGFGEQDLLVLHVGHVREGRNVGALERIQGDGIQVLMAGSTFFPADASLAHHLETRGIRFLTKYFDHIEEIYQLADLYVFPTLSEEACISQPLSVLEAMACNLPVVSTRFGGLPDLFPSEGGGLFYSDGTSDLLAKVKYVRDNLRHINPRTREMVEQYSWDKSCQEILRLVEQSRSPALHSSGTGNDLCATRDRRRG
jgi:glycosyltransferase involved in cell wall biosynthesis